MKPLLVLLMLLACAAGAGAQAPALKADPLANVGGEEFDGRFLRLMMEHHRQGLEMARLAAERSERDGLDELAARMSGQLEKELAEMEQLAGRPGESRSGLGRAGGAAGTNPTPDRGGERPTATPEDDVAGRHAEAMARLRAAGGEEFDRLFLQEMTKHHHAGFELNQVAAGRAGDREVAAFARRSAAQQQQDIEDMNARYAEWFR
ncbi:MAG TPA: DUF305 domain-containing protein [Opitutaceae bacterium]|nr:DUF305 domain-containing protein [Opitutaceae bacterium]